MDLTGEDYKGYMEENFGATPMILIMKDNKIISAQTGYGEYAAFGYAIDDESKKAIVEISEVETCRPHPAFADFPVEVIGVESIRLIDGE